MLKKGQELKLKNWKKHVLHKEILQGNARILCHPICSGEGDLEAVVEFVRTHGNAFTEDEIEVASKY